MSLWSALPIHERQILDRQLETGVQVFQTSSAGRLFDAVSGLLGVCTKVTYEGQAAIELESTAARFLNSGLQPIEESFSYPYEIRAENGVLILGVGVLFQALVHDLLQGVSREEIAFRFHITVARAIVDLAVRLGVESGPLVLSGGVFQNKLLTEAVLFNCKEKGIRVLRSRTLPPGDGGLAFGQLLIANEVL